MCLELGELSVNANMGAFPYVGFPNKTYSR